MMRGAMPLPLWSVVLFLAALAPFLAKGFASMFERRSRERSRRLLARLGSPIEQGSEEPPARPVRATRSLRTSPILPTLQGRAVEERREVDVRSPIDGASSTD